MSYICRWLGEVIDFGSVETATEYELFYHHSLCDEIGQRFFMPHFCPADPVHEDTHRRSIRTVVDGRELFNFLHQTRRTEINNLNAGGGGPTGVRYGYYPSIYLSCM